MLLLHFEILNLSGLSLVEASTCSEVCAFCKLLSLHGIKKIERPGFIVVMPPLLSQGWYGRGDSLMLPSLGPPLAGLRTTRGVVRKKAIYPVLVCLQNS